MNLFYDSKTFQKFCRVKEDFGLFLTLGTYARSSEVLEDTHKDILNYLKVFFFFLLSLMLRKGTFIWINTIKTVKLWNVFSYVNIF